jgi:hypothetical protein
MVSAVRGLPVMLTGVSPMNSSNSLPLSSLVALARSAPRPARAQAEAAEQTAGGQAFDEGASCGVGRHALEVPV